LRALLRSPPRRRPANLWAVSVTIEYASADDFAAVRAMLIEFDMTIEGLLEVPTSMFIAVEEDEIVGVAALERHGPNGLVRSVVVAEGHRGSGLGSRLVDAVEEEARQLGLDALYLLVEEATPFFAGCGYEIIERDAAPGPVMESVEWSEACSEDAVAMEKLL
jgi:amino-acid N-acetyltransferase